MTGRDIEESIRSERVLAAHRLLLDQMPKLGLTPSRKSGLIQAVRLHDIHDRYVFAWIPNQKHLLFYVRKPAMNAAPNLRASATSSLPRIRINNAGEVTSRLEGTQDAKTVLEWLSHVLPLPE